MTDLLLHGRSYPTDSTQHGHQRQCCPDSQRMGYSQDHVDCHNHFDHLALLDHLDYRDYQSGRHDDYLQHHFQCLVGLRMTWLDSPSEVRKIAHAQGFSPSSWQLPELWV